VSREPTPVNKALYDYIVRVGVPEIAAQTALRERTDALAEANMQVSADEGAFLAMLVRLTGAKRIIEVGTFTGYSALAMALALPEDGTLIACDVSREWTAIGQEYWAKAGVTDRIDLRIAPGTETLAALVDDGQAGTFDMAFIDADKENYNAYYESCLTLMRPGGLICVDNVLWGGSVLRADDERESTQAIRAFNAARATDERVDRVLITVGDGVSMLRKR
jgi:predicted O-methyltransferase YrrM